MPLETTPLVGLPADRLYDWNPGLDSVGGVPDRTTVFRTVHPGEDIQAAIDACPPGEVVQLAAGTFTVNNFLLVDKGITLRGAVDPVTNAPLTVLQKKNGAISGSYTAPDYQPIIIVGPSRYNNQTGSSTNLTSDAAAGTYSITLASTAGLSPGQFVILDEDDYTNASFIPLPERDGSPTSAEILASDRVVFMDHSPSDPGDDPFPDSLTWFSRMGRPLNELKEIASINGNTVTFTSPITTTYTVSKMAELLSVDDTFVKYAGVENLSLTGGSDGNVRFEDAAYSWMTNCDDTGWLGEGVGVDSSYRVQVQGSYIHDGAWSEPGGGGYAIGLDWGSAEALFETKITLAANKMMVGRSAGAGTVVAYNYTDDGFILTDPSWQEVGINGSHMVGSHSWLFEGNQSFNYDSDNTHGNAIYMTVFRNDLTGDRTDFANPEGNARAVGLMFGSWWQSIIGNVLGTPGQMTDWAYQSPGLGNQWGNDNIWEIGYDPGHWEQNADPKTVSTLIRGGNYDNITDSVHWEDIPSQTLPNSLYLSGKPAFFGSYTWPWVDPTGSTQLYILPAKARYDVGTPFLLPPVINVAATASYAAGGAATTLSPATTVGDADSPNLMSGTVSITNGLLAGDTLAASTAGTSITADYNASTGMLSLTGSDTLAHYQQVLDTVTYSSSSQNPTSYGADPSRTVSWVINDGVVSSPVQTTTVNLTGGPSIATLFGSAARPSTITENDPNAVDLGVKFQASTNGTIAGIRFYKGPQNTGTHIGDLWTSSGTLLASATFTNETASGWQQVNFSSPVPITAGTTYIASYEAPHGEYSADGSYFANSVTNGPLTALSSSSSGGNGVYTYGSSNPFPNNSYNASNYWVDVVFSASSQSPPSLSNVAATASYAAGGAATTLSPATTVSDSDSPNLMSGTVSITDGLLAGDTLAASTAGTSIAADYNASTGMLSLTGSDTLAHYQQVLDTVTYSSSSQNPTSYGADPSRTVSWVINDGAVSSPVQTTTVNLTGGPPVSSLFGSAARPGTITENDPNAVDLGVKFQASTNGTIVGIRFYKGPQNTGTHIGDLWTTPGTLLASATFTNETASGWQQVNFSSPVPITAGTTYIASYEAPHGEYSADGSYFAN